MLPNKRLSLAAAVSSLVLYSDSESSPTSVLGECFLSLSSADMVLAWSVVTLWLASVATAASWGVAAAVASA